MKLHDAFLIIIKPPQHQLTAANRCLPLLETAGAVKKGGELLTLLFLLSQIIDANRRATISSSRECISAIFAMNEMCLNWTGFGQAVKLEHAFLIIIKPPQHQLTIVDWCFPLLETAGAVKKGGELLLSLFLLSQIIDANRRATISSSRECISANIEMNKMNLDWTWFGQTVKLQDAFRIEVDIYQFTQSRKENPIKVPSLGGD